MEALLVLLVLSGFVASLATVVFLGSRSTVPAGAFHPVPRPAIPSRGRVALFSKAERSFYQALRTVVPDHMIFIKVKLADLVSLKPKNSFWDHFNPINRKRIDFVVCDPTLAPVLAIELDESGNSQSEQSAVALVNSILASASLPVVHVPHKRSYLFNELRRLLGPYLIVPRPLL